MHVLKGAALYGKQPFENLFMGNMKCSQVCRSKAGRGKASKQARLFTRRYKLFARPFVVNKPRKRASDRPLPILKSLFIGDGFTQVKFSFNTNMNRLLKCSSSQNGECIFLWRDSKECPPPTNVVDSDMVKPCQMRVRHRG